MQGRKTSILAATASKKSLFEELASWRKGGRVPSLPSLPRPAHQGCTFVKFSPSKLIPLLFLFFRGRGGGTFILPFFSCLPDFFPLFLYFFFRLSALRSAASPANRASSLFSSPFVFCDVFCHIPLPSPLFVLLILTAWGGGAASCQERRVATSAAPLFYKFSRLGWHQAPI